MELVFLSALLTLVTLTVLAVTSQQFTPKAIPVKIKKD